jgi:hypothetical protein
MWVWGSKKYGAMYDMDVPTLLRKWDLWGSSFILAKKNENSTPYIVILHCHQKFRIAHHEFCH